MEFDSQTRGLHFRNTFIPEGTPHKCTVSVSHAAKLGCWPHTHACVWNSNAPRYRNDSGNGRWRYHESFFFKTGPLSSLTLSHKLPKVSQKCVSLVRITRVHIRDLPIPAKDSEPFSQLAAETGVAVHQNPRMLRETESHPVPTVSLFGETQVLSHRIIKTAFNRYS